MFHLVIRSAISPKVSDTCGWLRTRSNSSITWVWFDVHKNRAHPHAGGSEDVSFETVSHHYSLWSVDVPFLQYTSENGRMWLDVSPLGRRNERPKEVRDPKSAGNVDDSLMAREIAD